MVVRETQTTLFQLGLLYLFSVVRFVVVVLLLLLLPVFGPSRTVERFRSAYQPCTSLSLFLSFFFFLGGVDSNMFT